MFYILYHSTEVKGRISKLNVESKTLEGLLALYNVTVEPIAAVYPQEGYRKKWQNGATLLTPRRVEPPLQESCATIEIHE